MFSPQEHGSNESPVESYSAYPIGGAKDTLEVFIASPHNSPCTGSTASKLSLHFVQPRHMPKCTKSAYYVWALVGCALQILHGHTLLNIQMPGPAQFL